jgi:Ribosomal S3Ae family
VDDTQNKKQQQGIHGSCLFSFRKFKLIAETVVGRRVLCNFHGMELATEKLRNCVRKGQLSYFILPLKCAFFNTLLLIKFCAPSPE